MDASILLQSYWFWPVVILLLFAALDLMVGVANDAVNFLNSAIGSKVASRKTIYRIAAGGILVGALLSSGMMEVARKGIFNPSMFSFYDIMIVFFSVVIADILLLDLYNSLRLPTSTTVSVIFELLGAGLGIALIYMFSQNLPVGAISDFINASSTTSIIAGIFLSVGVAFISGWVVQTILRSIFGFSYHSSIKKWGWLFGGIALTSITYFLLIKGLKGATGIPVSLQNWVADNILYTNAILFAIWSLCLVLLQKLYKVEILKVIVVVGTFALAAAFAGNDLVNFIGVSIAGYQSVMLFLSQGGGDIYTFMMGGLSKSVSTPWIFLLGSAVVMILTLMYSKKAQAVTETEIGLTRHATGQEQFKPGRMSRWMVKKAIQTHKMFVGLLPSAMRTSIVNKFYKPHIDVQLQKAPAFDLLRASVNLTLSAILIAIATNMKLPLSTTYVTFMVAMATALADGAWGRDSAVYRVSGVLTIIGSWLLTAFIALSLTLLLTILLWNLGALGVGIAVIVTLIILYRSHRNINSDINISSSVFESGTLLDLSISQCLHIINMMNNTLSEIFTAFIEDNEKRIIKVVAETQKISNFSKEIKLNIHTIFQNLSMEIADNGPVYIQNIEVMRKASLALVSLAEHSKEYILNRHPDFIPDQLSELENLKEQMIIVLNDANSMIHSRNFDYINKFDLHVDNTMNLIGEYKNHQFSRIKAAITGVRNTNLFIHILTESYTMLINIQKSVHYIKRMHK